MASGAANTSLHRPEPEKPQYPPERSIPNHPGVGYYGFDPDMDNNWLREGKQPGIDYQTEHVVEWQCFLSFYRFLDHQLLPDGQYASQWIHLNSAFVKDKLNSHYGDWAAASVSSSDRDRSAIDNIQRAFGGSGNLQALCFLEGRLNNLKEQIWNTRHNPISDGRWRNELSFREYDNIDRIEHRLCEVASVCAYLTHADVKQKLRDAIRETKRQLGIFDRAYGAEFERNVFLRSRWEYFIRVHFFTMAERTEAWFNRKFAELLENEERWVAANPAGENEIRNRANQLRTVKDSGIGIIQGLASLYDD